MDGLNGDSLPNAIVLLADCQRGLFSDSLGRFTFPGVPVGVHLIAIKQYGYAEVNIEVEVSEGLAPETEERLRQFGAGAQPGAARQFRGVERDVVPRNRWLT